MEGVESYLKEQAARYRKKGWWLGLTLSALFDRACDLYPDKDALVADGARCTFGELRARVERVAKGFVDLGIGTGDRVLIQLPNWPEFVVAYYALQKIGAVSVVLTPGHGFNEVQHLGALTDAVAWIVSSHYRSTAFDSMIGEVRRNSPQLKNVVVVGDHLAGGTVLFSSLECGAAAVPDSAYFERFVFGPDDVCTILPTGGTTGFPKAVPRSHNSYIHNAEYLARAWELNSLDHCLIMTAVGHNLALITGVVGCVFSCATMVLLDSSRPEDFCAVVERERVTCTALVPALVSRVLAYPEANQYDLSSLRMVYAGGQHSPAQLVRALKQKLGCQYVNGFGMSEGPVAQTRLNDPDEVIENTIGTPCCPYDEFGVLDAEGRCLGPGQEGELVVRGPGVFTGYFKAATENAKVFTPDGYFRSGDMARIDAQGRIAITGRIKDIIIRGGENISAVEVEQAVHFHPAVAAVSAVGMPDPELGERVCAYVRWKGEEGVTLAALGAFLTEKGVSKTLVPERLECVDEFPLTQAGKIDKKVLREAICSKLESAAAG